MSKVVGEVRHGTRGGRPDVRLLGGWFAFGSTDTTLLVSLLPSLIHVRHGCNVERLSTLVRLVGEETNERRSGRDLVLTRLVEVLLIEALRATQGEEAPRTVARIGRRAARAGTEADAQPCRASMDGGHAREVYGAVAVRILRPVQPHRRPCADGIPAGLADGRRQGSAPP